MRTRRGECEPEDTSLDMLYLFCKVEGWDRDTWNKDRGLTHGVRSKAAREP